LKAVKTVVQQKETMARLQLSNPNILQQLATIIQEQQQQQQQQEQQQQQQQQQSWNQSWNQWGGNEWDSSYNQSTGMDLALLVASTGASQVTSQGGGTWELANLKRRDESVINRSPKFYRTSVVFTDPHLILQALR